MSRKCMFDQGLTKAIPRLEILTLVGFRLGDSVLCGDLKASNQGCQGSKPYFIYKKIFLLQKFFLAFILRFNLGSLGWGIKNTLKPP